MLIIDVDVCLSCRKCVKNVPGFVYYIEYAIRNLICKRCFVPHCMAACSVNALSRDPEGKLVRDTLLCIACRRCSLLCPLGIMPKYVLTAKQLLPTAVSINKLSKTCSNGAVEKTDVLPEDVHVVDDLVALRTRT